MRNMKRSRQIAAAIAAAAPTSTPQVKITTQAWNKGKRAKAASAAPTARKSEPAEQVAMNPASTIYPDAPANGAITASDLAAAAALVKHDDEMPDALVRSADPKHPSNVSADKAWADKSETKRRETQTPASEQETTMKTATKKSLRATATAAAESHPITKVPTKGSKAYRVAKTDAANEPTPVVEQIEKHRASRAKKTGATAFAQKVATETQHREPKAKATPAAAPATANGVKQPRPGSAGEWIHGRLASKHGLTEAEVCKQTGRKNSNLHKTISIYGWKVRSEKDESTGKNRYWLAS